MKNLHEDSYMRCGAGGTLLLYAARPNGLATSNGTRAVNWTLLCVEESPRSRGGTP